MVLLSWLGLQFSVGEVIISEFMASSGRAVRDEDGEFSDWVELYNRGDKPVDLKGWWLTDSGQDLTQWQFPSVTILPNRFLVVFASGKDRAVAGKELHTNFRLASSGEGLALVRPDKSVASGFFPEYQPQAPEISFGVPMVASSATLVGAGAVGRFLAPADDSMGEGWQEGEWADSTWVPVRVGVGFEGSSPVSVLVVIAESGLDFSGVQGEQNWIYGYYNRTVDPVFGYQKEDLVQFPAGGGGHGADNYWTGMLWDWPGGNPPWTSVGARLMHPNGNNSGQEHWAIRRWTSEVSGAVTIQWQARKQESGGNGVTARVYLNGVQRDTVLLAGNDLVGVTKMLVLGSVQAGDVIDFAVAPTGAQSLADDRSDGTYLSATIRTMAGLESQVQTNLRASMEQSHGTGYLRIPFEVKSPGEFEYLSLRMQYKDGFVAYLNGVEVARRNAPEELAWNSFATERRSAELAVQWEEMDLSRHLGLMHAGTNLLAIHCLSTGAEEDGFLISPELRGSKAGLSSSNPRYFPVASPGWANGEGTIRLGPVIMEVAHRPMVPSEMEDLIVTARVAKTFDGVAKVSLRYRVMYGAEVEVLMSDDGQHGDGVAGDGVFGAVIPAGVASAGQMIRYYIEAEDMSGDRSRGPAYLDPLNSPRYFGTIKADPSVMSALPVYHWFVEDFASASRESGTRASLFYDGAFYDNIGVNLHGQSSASFPKSSYDFDFNRGHHFKYAAGERAVEDFNLLTVYPDKAHMRNILAYETYRDAGAPYHMAFPVRVQLNGKFFSVAHFVEDGDEDYLARVGLDPRGALYKMYNTFNSATVDVEKKTRKDEPNTDLQNFMRGFQRAGTGRTQYLYDNVNIPAMVNYLAAMIITGNVDCCHKNYYAYRDSEGTGEWQFLPWDVDLSFGRNWTSSSTYYDDTMYAENPLYVGGNNSLISILFATPAIKQMYLRRVRTLMDELLQPTNTPPAEFKYERRINELAASLAPDSALDYAKWPTWGRKQTLAQAVNILTNQYLPRRRSYLYRHRELPAAQPPEAVIGIGRIDFKPSSAKEEYVELINTNVFAVDISGWKLAGEVAFTFSGGTVVPARTNLFVTADLRAFRARTNGPGSGMLAVGGYRGQLPARGGTVHLKDRRGRFVDARSYAGDPSAAQQWLRIVEVMYHPAAPGANSPFSREDFEFIQLKNTGVVALDLTGVRFVAGVLFGFRGSRVNILQPGESVYVVKNMTAYGARYGVGWNVAGEFEGSLENAGERIVLVDGMDEEILSFEYGDRWHPATDGEGYSLAILNENGAWTEWTMANAWQASRALNGSPAEGLKVLAEWKKRNFNAAELADSLVGGDGSDPDGDGRSNLEEFISGTHPRDETSFLKVETAGLAESADLDLEVRVRFQALAGKTYTLQYAESAVRPVWKKLMDVPGEVEGGMIEVRDRVFPWRPTRYYRLVTPLQP